MKQGCGTEFRSRCIFTVLLSPESASFFVISTNNSAIIQIPHTVVDVRVLHFVTRSDRMFFSCANTGRQRMPGFGQSIVSDDQNHN